MAYATEVNRSGKKIMLNEEMFLCSQLALCIVTTMLTNLDAIAKTWSSDGRSYFTVEKTSLKLIGVSTSGIG